MNTLQGKRAIITGAGKGLGKAMALALAAEGVHLGLLGRTESDLVRVADEARALYAGLRGAGSASKAGAEPAALRVSYAVADVASLAAVEAGVAKLTGELSGVDILINNAGILKTGSIVDLPVADWEQVIQTNVLGTYYMIHAVLPYMLTQQKGDILNIASTAGLKGSANMSAYAASKAAVISLTESLMYEVRKQNIRVTTVNPSTIATDMTLGAKFTDGNPERVLQPEDLAFLVVNHLKLPQRAFVKEVGLWSTNP